MPARVVHSPTTSGEGQAPAQPGATNFGDALLAVGKAGLEPARLSARDPKSRSSASSDTPPVLHNTIGLGGRQTRIDIG